MPEARCGGDLDLEENWHGPERTYPEHNAIPGEMPESYSVVAKRTIGRWAGDRIAFVGDYAEANDLPPEYEADKIYGLCHDMEDGDPPEGAYTDITSDVCAVIAHELQMRIVGDGWAHWINQGEKWCRRCYKVVNADDAQCPVCNGMLE